MFEKIKSFRWGYILIALVLAAIGVSFIAFHNALKILAVVIGVVLCVFAIIYAVLALADKKRGVGFAFKIFFAVMALISGLVTAIFNSNSIEIIIAVFALILIIDSSFKLNTSAMSKRYKVIGWWFVMSIAAISIAISFTLLKFVDFDPENPAICSIMLGLAMILNSANNFLSAFYTSKFERKMENEIIDAKKEELAANTSLESNSQTVNLTEEAPLSKK